MDRLFSPCLSWDEVFFVGSFLSYVLKIRTLVDFIGALFTVDVYENATVFCIYRSLLRFRKVHNN